MDDPLKSHPACPLLQIGHGSRTSNRVNPEMEGGKTPEGNRGKALKGRERLPKRPPGGLGLAASHGERRCDGN